MSMYQNNTEALSQYIQSMVKLEELQKMTEDLDKELEDSQRLMSEIKSIFNTVPNGPNRPELNCEVRREQFVRYLAADEPRMLMPDMAEAVVVDIETILAGLKNHAENLKKSIALSPEPQRERADAPNGNLNLQQYAASLDEFTKRLANIKFNTVNRSNRSKVLEMKLGMLIEDVNNLTQAVQAKTKLTEANQNWTSNELDNATVLCYNNLIDKLLHTVNEATYLLKSNN